MAKKEGSDSSGAWKELGLKLPGWVYAALAKSKTMPEEFDNPEKVLGKGTSIKVVNVVLEAMGRKPLAESTEVEPEAKKKAEPKAKPVKEEPKEDPGLEVMKETRKVLDKRKDEIIAEAVAETPKTPTKIISKPKKAKESEGGVPKTAKERIKLALSVVQQMSIEQYGVDLKLVGVASDPQIAERIDYELLPTGITALDAICDGGIPRGKFTVLCGPEQSAKTSLALKIIATDQARDPESVWLWADSEGAFDWDWARKQGVDLDRILFVLPNLMEVMMQECVRVMRTGSVKGVVFDSLGAMVPIADVKKKRDDKEWTKTLSETNVAEVARRLSVFFRVANIPANQMKVAVICIAHVYTPIGDDYKEFEVKGGNALKHWAHLRLMMTSRKGDQDRKVKILMPDGNERDMLVAKEIVCSADKTRQGPHAGHKVAIPFVFGQGLSEVESIIQAAFAWGVIQTKGAWYYHSSFPERTEGKGDRWINGREKAEEFIRKNPDCFSAILEDYGNAVVQHEVGSKAESGPADAESSEE